jgi:hypothetical protein
MEDREVADAVPPNNNYRAAAAFREVADLLAHHPELPIKNANIYLHTKRPHIELWAADAAQVAAWALVLDTSVGTSEGRQVSPPERPFVITSTPPEPDYGQVFFEHVTIRVVHLQYLDSPPRRMPIFRRSHPS